MGRCQKRHATTLPTHHSVCNCPWIVSHSFLTCASLHLHPPRCDCFLPSPLQIRFLIRRFTLLLVAIPQDMHQITTNQTNNVVSRFGQSPSPVDHSFRLSNAFFMSYQIRLNIFVCFLQCLE